MSTTEPLEPESVERAAQAEAGVAASRSDVASANTPPPPDYDTRQDRISTERKPAGPPEVEAAAAREAASASALDASPAEDDGPPPTDPA